ncbi:MAG: hypothetical protein U9P50_01130 [Patescibacteria group bacterium]|nr:hypothetical protein [Patescibacteria group bacterium]
MKRIVQMCLVVVVILWGVNVSADEGFQPDYQEGKGFNVSKGKSFFAKAGFRSQFKGVWDNEDSNKTGVSIQRAWLCTSGWVKLPSQVFEKLTFDIKFDVKNSNLLDFKLGSSVDFGFAQLLFSIGQEKFNQSVKEKSSVWTQSIIGSRPLGNEKFNRGRRPGVGVTLKFWDGRGEFGVSACSANGINKSFGGQYYASSLFLSFWNKYNKKVAVSHNSDHPFSLAVAGSYNLTKLDSSNIGKIGSDDGTLKSIGMDKISLTEFNSSYGGDLSLNNWTCFAGVRWERLSVSAGFYGFNSTSDGSLKPSGKGFYLESYLWVWKKILLLSGVYSKASVEDGNRDIFDQSQIQFGPKAYPFEGWGEAFCVGLYGNRAEDKLKDTTNDSIWLELQIKF